MKECFKTVRCLYKTTKDLIEKCNRIIEDWQAQGYTLTLRQLYYQLIGLDWFPEERRWRQAPGTNKFVRDPNGTKNAQPNYDWLGVVVSDARLLGLIDWDAIEDRGRVLRGVPHWETPEEIIEGCANQYRIDKWRNQPSRVEVWVEKDALIGVLERACSALDVKWFSTRGYGSQTALYDASKRLIGHHNAGQEPVIIHLADHDPSGIDMSRDIFDRLETFTAPYGLRDLNVNRIALNIAQVREFKLPESPAKEADSRHADYVRKFGPDSWELDALTPAKINELITEAVLEFRDEDIWEEDKKREETDRGMLKQSSKRWHEVRELMKKKPKKVKPPKIGRGWRKITKKERLSLPLGAQFWSPSTKQWIDSANFIPATMDFYRVKATKKAKPAKKKKGAK